MGYGPQLMEAQPHCLKLKEFGQFILPLMVAGMIWQLAVSLGFINAAILPAPSMIVQEFYRLIWVKQVLLHHLVCSLYRLAIGYIFAVAVGIFAGALLGLNRTVREMFSPTLSLLIAVPTIAWVPVLLVTMGLGDKTVITAVFLGGVFEMTYSMMAGIRSVNRQLINAAHSMGVTGPRLFFKVLIPASLAMVMPALRLSNGYCWRALVGAEMLCAMIQWGVGKMIYEARFWNNVKVMFVGLILIGVFAVLLDRILLKPLERSTVEKWGMLSGS
jgi:ABC-type nitrate/sulfonate/bicarbonate transport system permease component